MNNLHNSETSHLTREQDDEPDFQRYFGLFLSNWYWFVAALFIALMLAYGINTYSEKIYTVSSSLLIKEDRGSELTGIEQIIPGGDIFRSQQNLKNEIGILKSFSLNYRVMKELPEFQVTVVGVGRRGVAHHRHYKSEPFRIVFDTISEQRPGVQISLRIISDDKFTLDIDGTHLGKEEYSFGEKINEAGFDFTIIKRETAGFEYNPELSNRYIIWFNRPETLANVYRSKLSVEPIDEEATLVTLRVSGVSPAQEADYLNKLMGLYIRQGLEYKNQTAEKTIEFIDKQLQTISDSLKVAEDKLENFRYENRLIDLSAEGTAIKTKLERYSQEKVSAMMQKQYYEYLDEYIRTKNESGDIVSPSIMGVTDPLLVSLVDELSKLQTQRKQIKYNLAADLPSLDLIDSKIEDTRRSLSENIKNNILNVERTLRDINARISEVEAELNKLPGTERKLINIQRQFDLNNTVYTYMLEKRSEAGIAKASNVSSNRVIDPANFYNAAMISPKTRRNYLFAIIFGLFIPGLYIVIVDQFHNRIIDKKDIEKGTDVPIIGFVGHNKYKSEMPVKDKPGSSLSESFRSIRTNLKFYLNGGNKAVISVTSTLSGEGKTFIASNLAGVLAMAGKKTLLADADLRKPRLNKIIGIEGTAGLTDYLIGEVSVDDIINKTDIEGMDFISAGSVPPNPSELIESERMKQFMAEIKEKYDFVVFDTPPVGVVSDALLLGDYTDINIFVVRQKFSFKSTLDLIQSIYEKKELRNIAIAVNDIYISGYYGYGLRYGYGFYKGYGYNYGYGQYGSYGREDYRKYYLED